MRWYVVMWGNGGATLSVRRADAVGFTKCLASAVAYNSREEAWAACRMSRVRRAVPECEEVVVRYLVAQSLEGRA